LCNQITIYSVPGPNRSPGILQQTIGGGWAYTLENLEFLSKLNPDCKFQVVLGHVEEFGPIPELPSISGMSIQVFETTLKTLSDTRDLASAEQHGAILNYILESHQLQTDFYLIIDPDCYLLMPNAFHQLIDHMNLHQIQIIGVSYPSTLPKVYYWDFPTAYFQFMKAEKCHPRDLDFLPEHTSLAAGTGISTFESSPMAKILKIVTLTIRYLRIPLKRILLKMQNSNYIFLQIVFYFAINFPYRNAPLFKDTGWKNREKFKTLKSQVIPHRIKRSNFQSSLDKEQYAFVHLDVGSSAINPSWHALMHGLYEERDFGGQKIMWRLLHKLLEPNQKLGSSHPATSILMADSFLDSYNLDSIGNFQYAYEYHWMSKPFCVHLGHGGKENPEVDIPKLRKIRSQLPLSYGGTL
jgi:hypothetical protein